MFPKAHDLHKPGQPLVPNGLGVIYVLASAAYLFLLYYFQPGISSLVLAVCILFGGFMGLLDDWMDLRWRYKAFFPLIAAIPLVALATQLGLRTDVKIPFVGTVDFGPNLHHFVIIPLIVTVATNTVNQLGGLNGLETVCPAIIMGELMFLSGSNAVLLIVPLLMWLVLAVFNFQGKIFVGNTGSFAVGMTLAASAIISDLKTSLVISLLPYILNSCMILLTYLFIRTRASVSFDGEKLCSTHRRSLITIVTYNRRLSERQVVAIISLLVAISTLLSIFVQLFLT